jgi:hypothetical protein
MAAQVRVVVHPREVARLLRGDGEYSAIRADLEARGHRVAARAGAGVDVRGFEGRDRFRVHVRAMTVDAKIREHRDRSLTRALDAAR